MNTQKEIMTPCDTATSTHSTARSLHLSSLLLMASITCLAVLSELMPSGVLPAMIEHFSISQTQAAGLVGAYAVASAIFGIPLVSLTVSRDRKKLLAVLLIGFAASNLMVALSPQFHIALVGRALGGICAGTLWPMITAYGMSLVPRASAGKAVAIIMSGITVGMSVGQPCMTWIGRQFGFQFEFAVMALLIVGVMVLCMMFLPHVKGEKRSRENSPFTMLANPGILLVIALTFLGVGANYGVYTFITTLISTFSYPSVELAQIWFGIGSIISVTLILRFIDTRLHLFLVSMFVLGCVAMLVFYSLHFEMVLHGAFVLWGIAFGSLSSIFQTATARQVRSGTAVANALQSCSFNVAIMFGSTTAGFLLETGGIEPIVLGASAIFFVGMMLSVCTRSYFA